MSIENESSWIIHSIYLLLTNQRWSSHSRQDDWSFLPCVFRCFLDSLLFLCYIVRPACLPSGDSGWSIHPGRSYHMLDQTLPTGPRWPCYFIQLFELYKYGLKQFNLFLFLNTSGHVVWCVYSDAVFNCVHYVFEFKWIYIRKIKNRRMVFFTFETQCFGATSQQVGKPFVGFKKDDKNTCWKNCNYNKTLTSTSTTKSVVSQLVFRPKSNNDHRNDFKALKVITQN